MDTLAFILYRLVCAAIMLLPLGVAFRLGGALGGLAYWLSGSYRRRVRRNMAIAFGDEQSSKERERLVRAHFGQLGANLFASIKVASMSEEAIWACVTVENLEAFQAAQSAGKGVVWIASHMGNWELLAPLSARLFPGCENGTIYRRIGNRHIDADVRAARARFGLHTFERKEGFLGAIALVRKGGTVAVLMDQHAGDIGLWCPLFGRLASTSPLAATLALRTGAVVLGISVITERSGHWRIAITDPLPTKGEDVASLTGAINGLLEQQIRRSPADWFWVHNRWKTPAKFLIAESKRGVALPRTGEGMELSALKPFRILIRASNWLGDAVMGTPAVLAIKAGRPDAHITILTRAKLADYWKRVPGVDAVIPIEAEESLWAVSQKIRGQFEAAIVMPNSIRTGLEVWLARIPCRVGDAVNRRGMLFHYTLPPPRKKEICSPARHQVHHYLNLARRIGADVPRPEDAAALAEVEAAAFDLLPPRTVPNVSSGKIKIGLCPGAEYGPAKRWLPERFAETAAAVAKAIDCEWVLFGVAGDAPVGAAIEESLSALGVRCTNRIGQTTLGELMDELAQCRLLLTNDTGTMHLAAFLGVPTVAVFGSTEPRLTAPLGRGHQVLRHQVECSPCFLRECPLDFRCMQAVTAQEAAAAVLKGLRGDAA